MYSEATIGINDINIILYTFGKHSYTVFMLPNWTGKKGF